MALLPGSAATALPGDFVRREGRTWAVLDARNESVLLCDTGGGKDEIPEMRRVPRRELTLELANPTCPTEKVETRWTDAVVDKDAMTVKERKRYERNVGIMDAFLMEYFEDLSEYATDREKPLYRICEERFGVSDDTVRRVCCAWLRAGRRAAAIAPKRVVPPKDAYIGQKKRGRKGAGTDIDERAAESFEWAAEYIRSSGDSPCTVAQAYVAMVGERYFDELMAADDLVKKGRADEARCLYPTERQLREWLKKHMSEFDRKHGTRTESDILNNDRALLGDTRKWCEIPGAICEMDEHEYGLAVVSQSNRRRVVGRVHVYFLFDVATGAILAAVATLEVNSYDGAASCMLNLVENHRRRAMDLQLDMDDFFWPDNVLPRAIRVDHGAEFVSHAFWESLSDLHIARCTVPVAQGSMKPFVERSFGRLRQFIEDSLTGNGRILKTHGSTHYKDAVMTVREFEDEILFPFVVDHNRHCMDEYGWTKEMEEEGVEHTPEGVWHFLEERGGEAYPVTDPLNYRATWLRPATSVGKPRFDASGIHLKGLDYDPSGDPDLLAVCMASASTKVRPVLKLDPRDTGHLYWVHGQRIVKVPLKRTRAMEGLGAYTWQEWTKEKKRRDEQKRRDRTKNQVARAKAGVRSRQKVAEAAAMTGKGPKDTSDMRAAYNQERNDLAHARSFYQESGMAAEDAAEAAEATYEPPEDALLAEGAAEDAVVVEAEPMTMDEKIEAGLWCEDDLFDMTPEQLDRVSQLDCAGIGRSA